MHEILKKRIEEAELAFADREYEVGEIDHDALCKGFSHGAEYALFHQFISVEDALPEYDEAVLIIDKTGIEGNGVYFNHRSNNPIVKTYENGFCDIGLSEVMYWCEVPKFEPKKK